MPFLLLLVALGGLALNASAAEFFVSPQGRDSNPGTRQRPLQTLTAAQTAARRVSAAGQPVTVWLRGGTYYLAQPFILTSEDSGSEKAPVTYASYAGEEAIVSGGTRLRLQWTTHRDRIFKAPMPAGLTTDQLFVNGSRQTLARYPNRDSRSQYFEGWSPDAFSKERAARWNDPRGGYIHAMHRHMWGDFHYRITGKDADGTLTYEGGWQNNRQLGMHDKYRYVENILEELDAPGEWFLDSKAATLYFYPPPEVELATAVIEVPRLPHLIELRGTQAGPVRWIRLRGLTFRHALRTFMDTREPLLRSDWTIYRGGALFFTGTEDCAIEECTIDQVGGNGIFVNLYNRRLAVRRCHIMATGASGVAFAGDPKAVRSPLFEYAQRQTLREIDRTPGPLTANYPADCVLEDSLLHGTGVVEKQSAAVQISMAQSITVRHCSIYDTPRAGINISEGTWGGHVIEFCDVFDTVKETGDHGSFNSWGRDRYWELKDVDAGTLGTGENRDLPTLDALKTVILRNNRWRCDHGWDIDLDDGSTNYHIYNNLTLSGGIKLREGFHRTVENNVMVNNSFHPHVWYPNSQDTFRRNIVFTPYKPIRVAQPWGRQCDSNLLHISGLASPHAAAKLQSQSGRDEHSMEGDARFLDPAKGDYRVHPDSIAIQLGFQNFAMDRFGVQWPKWKALARTPQLPTPGAVSQSVTAAPSRDAASAVWLGATVRNIIGMGEVSAAGLPGEMGILILEVPLQSRAAAVGLRPGDVVLKIDNQPTQALRDLQRVSADTASFGTVAITIFREQREVVLEAESPIR